MHCCYHNKASRSVATPALSEAGSGVIVRDGVCSAKTNQPFPSSPPPPPRPLVLSAAPIAAGLRQRGTDQHNPQRHSISGQSCCLCNMLAELRVRREAEEEGQNEGSKEGKCLKGQQIYTPLTSSASAVCPPRSFRRSLVTL